MNQEKSKSPYVSHAERELQAIGYDLSDTAEGPNKWMVDGIMKLLEVFDEQGHSGSSAPYCVEIFRKLAMFEPLGPLTGEDDEWFDHGSTHGDVRWQNKRCGAVFRNSDGYTYYLYGKVFREPNGSCYTNHDSKVEITFPYTPKTEYVDVPSSAFPAAALD